MKSLKVLQNLKSSTGLPNAAVVAAVDGGGNTPSFNFETKKVELNFSIYANGKTAKVLSGVYDAAVCDYSNILYVQSAISEQFGNDGWVNINIPNDSDFIGTLHTQGGEQTCIFETQVGEINNIPSDKATILYNSDDDAYYLSTSDGKVRIDIYQYMFSSPTLILCKEIIRP